MTIGFDVPVDKDGSSAIRHRTVVIALDDLVIALRPMIERAMEAQ